MFETSLREALLTETKDNICAHFDRSIELCILIVPEILKWPNKLSHVFKHLLQTNTHENKTNQCTNIKNHVQPAATGQMSKSPRRGFNMI